MQISRNENIKTAFAARLRELRTKHNHTQAYLAQKLHTSKSSVSNWEKALRTPDMQTLLNLAVIYSVSIEYLLGNSKRPRHYVPEEKFIDKARYIDLHTLNANDQRTLKAFYAFLLEKY